MKVSMEGRRKLERKLREAERDVKSRVNRAVAEVAEDLLQKAIPLTPLEHGELRQSGFVDHRPGEADVGFAARYALYVHEMGITVYPERAPINWTVPGTGAKYLQRPFLENRQRYANYIKDAARRGLDAAL